MTLAEKFRFLADRLEDGKEFYLGDVVLRFDSETSDMIMKNYDGVWFYSNIKVNIIDNHDVKSNQTTGSFIYRMRRPVIQKPA